MINGRKCVHTSATAVGITDRFGNVKICKFDNDCYESHDLTFCLQIIGLAAI